MFLPTDRPARPTQSIRRDGNPRSVFAKLLTTLSLVFLLLGGNGLNAAAAGAFQEPSDDKIKLPEGQETPVFVFDQAGGFRRAPDQDKDFQLFASGKVIAQQNGSSVEFQLDSKQLQAFLGFVVNENNLYDHKSEAIVDEMEKLGKAPNQVIADAPSSEFLIDLPQGKHSVSVYAMFMARRDFPKLEAVQQLSNIEDRCRNLVAREVLGKRAQPIIDTVNAELKKQGLPIEPVTMDELRSASVKTTGRVIVSFTRQQPDADDKRNASLNVQYFVKEANADPTVRVFGLQRE